MRLHKLLLHNFQGCREFEFSPDGASASIYGDNGTGKTTIYNAFSWLLFDQDSLGRGDFSPKTTGADGQPLHNLEHSVEGVFELPDGEQLMLKKVFREKWTQKRGSPEKTFSGHETDHYINGVPSAKRDYINRISAIIDPKMAQVLTHAGYFAETLHWQERRKILLEVCGNVSDADVIAADPALAELPDYLRMPSTDKLYTVDEYRKIAAAQLKQIHDDLERLPAKIDEAHRAKPDTGGLDAEELRSAISMTRTLIDDCTAEKAALSQSNGADDIKKLIADLTMQKIKAESDYIKRNDAAAEEPRAQLRKVQSEILMAESALSGLKSEEKRITKEFETAVQERAEYAQKYMEVKTEEWKDGSDETYCPTCRRVLPDAEVAAMKKQYNERKAQKLEEISKTVEAKCSKAKIAELGDEAEKARNKVESAEKLVERLYTQRDALMEAKHEPIPFAQTPDALEFDRQIAGLKEKMNAGSDTNAQKVMSIQSKIDELRRMIEQRNGQLAMIEIAAKQDKRVKELAAEQKQKAAEHAKIQKGVYLCESFTRAKVAMLDERINSQFKAIKWRLFEEQVNGGIKDICEPLVPTTTGLVPYYTANRAAQINAGLEIIDTLGDYWGVSLPVFVDNAESVTQLVDIRTQVVRLVVSEQDKNLRVEI